MLEKIQSSSDLKKLNDRELSELCDEIRSELIRTVSENGGHLASNLGVVELTLALHRVFNLPDDRVIFDVGHQSYVHKMLSDRFDRMEELRRPVDELEMLVGKDYWPMPSYGDLLFEV